MKKELNSIGRLELVLVRPYCVFIYEVRCVLVQSEDINDSIRRRRDAFFMRQALDCGASCHCSEKLEVLGLSFIDRLFFCQSLQQKMSEYPLSADHHDLTPFPFLHSQRTT